MKIQLRSKRFLLQDGQCFLNKDPTRLARQIALGALKDSVASFDLQESGEFSLDMVGVKAVDLRSGQPVRIASFSIGFFELTERDLQTQRRSIDADQGAVVRIRVVDPDDRPHPDCDVTLVLPGRSIVFNPARDGDWIVCPPYESWLAVKGQAESPAALPAQAGEKDHTITLTVRPA